MKKGQRPSVHYRTSKRGKRFIVNPNVMKRHKNKSYHQLRRKFKIHPLRDDDKDGVPNYRDCRPFDKKKQDLTLEELREWDKEQERKRELSPTDDSGFINRRELVKKVYDKMDNDNVSEIVDIYLDDLDDYDLFQRGEVSDLKEEELKDMSRSVLIETIRNRMHPSQQEFIVLQHLDEESDEDLKNRLRR